MPQGSDFSEFFRGHPTRLGESWRQRDFKQETSTAESSQKFTQLLKTASSAQSRNRTNSEKIFIEFPPTKSGMVEDW